MSKNPDRYTERSTENSRLFSYIFTLAKEHPRLAGYILAGLTAISTATFFESVSPVSAADMWKDPTSQKGGTVPARWDTFKFGLTDENGVNPDDAMISAYYVENGAEDRIFGPSRMEKDQEYHVAAFPVLPGQDVKFSITTDDSAKIHTVSELDDEVENVQVSNPSNNETHAVFNIDTSPAPELRAAQEIEPLTTITTTLNTLDGQNEAMKVELKNQQLDLAFQMEGLITGTIGVDVKQLTEVVSSAQAAGTESANNFHLGTVSGNSSEGLQGTLEMNGKTYTIDSDMPFSGNEEISIDQNGNLVISNYDTNEPEELSNTLFLPSLNRQ